mmetsp:Transcript_54993/g.87317  ORF Transcript_54993/g.87317 Transcript_54993/m.87317 type:complete len:283 (+) Transcript_54993:1151-1999(+)
MSTGDQVIGSPYVEANDQSSDPRNQLGVPEIEALQVHHHLPLGVKQDLKVSNASGQFIVGFQQLVAMICLHQTFDGGTLAVSFLGHQFHAHPVGPDKVDDDQHRVDNQWNSTAREFLQNEDGNHRNLAQHGPKLKEDQIALRHQIRDIFHDTDLQGLHRHQGPRFIGVAQVFAEEIHPQVVANVESHFKNRHFKEVDCKQNHIGQDPGQAQGHRCPIAVTRDPQFLLCLGILHVQDCVDQIDPHKDRCQVVGIAKIRKHQIQNGLPFDGGHVTEAEANKCPK